MNTSEHVPEKAQLICNPLILHCPSYNLDNSQKTVILLVWNGSRNDQVVQVLKLATFHQMLIMRSKS